MTTYSMSEFITDVCAINAEDLPAERTLEKIAPLARRIAGESDWMEERFLIRWVADIDMMIRLG